MREGYKGYVKELSRGDVVTTPCASKMLLLLRRCSCAWRRYKAFVPEWVSRGLRLSFFVCDVPIIQVPDARLLARLAWSKNKPLNRTYTQIRSEA